MCQCTTSFTFLGIVVSNTAAGKGFAQWKCITSGANSLIAFLNTVKYDKDKACLEMFIHVEVRYTLCPFTSSTTSLCPSLKLNHSGHICPSASFLVNKSYTLVIWFVILALSCLFNALRMAFKPISLFSSLSLASLSIWHAA